MVEQSLKAVVFRGDGEADDDERGDDDQSGRLAMMCMHPCTACMALAVPVIVFTTPRPSHVACRGSLIRMI